MDGQKIPIARLPRPLTSFIGRVQEVALVIDRLRRDEVRLLTLTGPGGVGKTRLAIRVAESIAAEYPDGVWFVPLAPVHDPEFVASTIARTLEVPETGDRPIGERIAAFLADRRGLLIVDNFEHVLEAGPLLTELLAACPGLTVLVTSRTVLRLSGEHDVAVPPLSLPRPGGIRAPNRDEAGSIVDASEAVRLFVERATAAAAEFALTAEDATDVAALCTRLDGLPLAIELAAARVPTLPPRAMLQRLDQRLRLLTGGARDQPVRLRSMRDAIAWSYDLLSTEEQTLFRRLAIFVGGFTLEAVEAVCMAGLDPACDVLEGISSLTDKSLQRHEVGADGEPRYQMLETVREFGLEQLQAHGEEDSVRDAHLGWSVSFIERTCPPIHGPERNWWLPLVEAEHDNLRAALAWSLERQDGEAALRLAGALRDFWYLRGHIPEGRRWLEAAVAIGADAPAGPRARALFGLGWFANDLGDVERGTAALQESLALYRSLGDRLGTGLALDLLGCAAEDQGDYATAEPLMTEARTCFVEVGNRHCISQSTYHLGVIAYGQGELDLAMTRFDESLRLARAEGDAFNITNNLFYQTLIHRTRGQFAQAADAVEEALTLERAAGSNDGVATCLADLAVLAVAVGRPEAATRLLGTAGSLRDQWGMSPFDFPERVDYDRALDDARNRLGEPAFRAAWAEGRARTIEDLDADIAEVLAAARSQPTAATPPNPAEATGLTARELEVLRLVAAGHSNREIADALFISVPTVKRHLTNVLGKLALPSRSAATAYAHTHGLA